MGAFVPTKLIKKTIEFEKPILSPEDEWADPEVPEFTGETESLTGDIFIRRMNSADEIAMARGTTGADDDALYVCVYRVVVNEDGSQFFESVDQVKSLAGWFLTPLVNAIEDLQPKKSNSRRATSSGSNSRSRSAVGRRKSGRKPSPRSGEKS